MKKLLTKIFVALFACVGALGLFACGGGDDNKNAYEVMTEALTTIMQENSSSNMLTSGEVEGVSSNYLFRHYVTGEARFDYYNQLIALPMNFINNYKDDLKRLDEISNISGEKQQVVNKLNSSIPAWVDAFKTASEEYKSLTTIFDGGAPEDALLEIFNRSLYDFYTTSYNVATNLAQVKNLVLDDYSSKKETNDGLDESDTIELRDYITLKLGNDFYKCLIQGFDMEDYTNLTGSANVNRFVSFNKNVKAMLVKVFNLQKLGESELASLQGDPIFSEVTNELLGYKNTKVEMLLNVEETMDSERVLLAKAMDKFYIDDFYVKYSCSLDAYEAKESYASNYFNEISTYYTSYVSDYLDYLIENMKSGENND